MVRSAGRAVLTTRAPGRRSASRALACDDAPPPDVAAASWSAPLRALVDAVAGVRAQVPTDLPGPQAVAEAEVLLQQLETLRSVVLTRIADVDTRTLHTTTGAPSTSTWLHAQQTSLTRSDVAFARRLAAFPALATAVETGQLPVTGAGRIAAALTKARPHLDRPDGLIDGQPGEQTLTAVVVDGVLTAVCQAHAGLTDDDPRLTDLLSQLETIAHRPASQLDRLTDALLLLATSLEPAQLPGALALLLDALLPQQLEDRAERAHEHRGLRLRRKDDGSGWLITRGELDLECGELLQTVLDAERAVDPDNPLDTATWTTTTRDGEQPDFDDDSRAAPALAGRATPRRAAQRPAPLPRQRHHRPARQDRPAPRRHRQPRQPARHARQPARRRRLRRAPAAQPGPAMAVRQRRHPLRAQPRRQGPRGQPHRPHPHRHRTPRQTPRDRRPLPDRRLRPRTRLPTRPAPPHPLRRSAAPPASTTPSCSANRTTTPSTPAASPSDSRTADASDQTAGSPTTTATRLMRRTGRPTSPGRRPLARRACGRPAGVHGCRGGARPRTPVRARVRACERRPRSRRRTPCGAPRSAPPRPPTPRPRRPTGHRTADVRCTADCSYRPQPPRTSSRPRGVVRSIRSPRSHVLRTTPSSVLPA